MEHRAASMQTWADSLILHPAVDALQLRRRRDRVIAPNREAGGRAKEREQLTVMFQDKA